MNEEERAQQQLIHHCQMAECRSGSESALKSYFQSNEYEIASKTPFCHSMLAWNNCELRNALFFLSILSYDNSFESNISWNHEIIYNIPFFVCINDCRKRIKTFTNSKYHHNNYDSNYYNSSTFKKENYMSVEC